MLIIKIKTGNEAFTDGQTGWEVARILKDAARFCENGLVHGDEKRLLDLNGNKVGTLTFREDK